jgi:type VI secretion system protein ImpK
VSPQFSKVIDPIFEAALRFEAKIESSQDDASFNTADERATLIRKIDAAEVELGKSNKAWELAKYAICGWIDARLIASPWKESNWWNNNCLEQRYFKTQLAHHRFFEKAIEAEDLPEKDALEVFYLAVVLGFRGFYKESPSVIREKSTELDLPDSAERWCQRVYRSLQLRQGNMDIPGQVIPEGLADPLLGRNLLLQYSMISFLLLAIAIGCALWVTDFFNNYMRNR